MPSLLSSLLSTPAGPVCVCGSLTARVVLLVAVLQTAALHGADCDHGLCWPPATTNMLYRGPTVGSSQLGAPVECTGTLTSFRVPSPPDKCRQHKVGRTAPALGKMNGWLLQSGATKLQRKSVLPLGCR